MNRYSVVFALGLALAVGSAHAGWLFPKGVGDYGPDHLTFDLDESSRLSLSFYGKRPGPGMTSSSMSRLSSRSAGSGRLNR